MNGETINKNHIYLIVVSVWLPALFSRAQLSQIVSEHNNDNIEPCQPAVSSGTIVSSKVSLQTDKQTDRNSSESHHRSQEGPQERQTESNIAPGMELLLLNNKYMYL